MHITAVVSLVIDPRDQGNNTPGKAVWDHSFRRNPAVTGIDESFIHPGTVIGTYGFQRYLPVEGAPSPFVP